MADYDVVVVGGGMVGAALAYGLAGCGRRTVVRDQGDSALRAARGNFGLVWVQGKGEHCPPYAEWTRRAADLWPGFSEELADLTGIDLGYARPGGMHLCLSSEELAERDKRMRSMAEQSAGAFRYEILDHDVLARRVPGLGRAVAGASFSAQDGHANPLFLLRALHAGLRLRGGTLHVGHVEAIVPRPAGFEIRTGAGVHAAPCVVLAAGLGARALAAQVGLTVPVRPERGQILVTERVAPFLDYPTSQVRQTREGSILLGDSHEDVGFDDGTTAAVMGAIARRAERCFPRLGRARVVRAWGALRTLTPDGLPIYDQSETCPGAFSACAHSGVTLAAAHALELARHIADRRLPPHLAPLSENRFHVH